MPECVKVEPAATKRCTKCGVVKGVEEMVRGHVWCKSCASERQRYRDADKAGLLCGPKIPDGFKQCNFCLNMLDDGQFYASARYGRKCRKCCREYRAGRLKTVLEYNIKYRRLRPEFSMFHAAKKRAREKGIPFSITMKDVVVGRICPLLGVPMRRSAGRLSPFSPTLDRIIPSRGYIPGNVVVVSYRANAIKNDASIDEIRTIVRNLEFLLAHKSKTPHGPAGLEAGADGWDRTNVSDATSIVPNHSATSATGTEG